MARAIENARFNQRLWAILANILEEKIESARIRLETCSLDDVQSHQAEIRVLKEILNLPETRDVITEADQITTRRKIKG